MMKLIKWGAIVVVLLAIGAAMGSSSEDDSGKKIAKATDKASETVKDNTGTEDAVADEPEPTPEPRVRETPDPDGRYEVNCDYLLPEDFETEDYKFVAGGTLENTGNVGIKVRITYKWDLLGQAPFKETDTVRIRRGQEKDVNVTFPVTSGQIDAHQSADGDCDVKVKILDTFGKPPYED